MPIPLHPGLQEKVHNTIKQRFQDSSSAVRDAAIDLVGKYLTQKPEITKQYYPVISERILVRFGGRERGCLVFRRRLKMHANTVSVDLVVRIRSDERSMMVDIVCKLANRVNDEDNNVKDLALRTLQEILFVPFRGQKHQEIYYEYDENDDSIEGHRGEFARMSTLEKKEVQARSMVVVGVLQALLNSSGSADILEEMIKKTLEKADGKQKRVVMGICQCMVDCLIDQLLTLDEREKSDAISKAIMGCINAILIFSRAGPNLLVGNNHVKTLKPYLMGERTSEDELRTLRCVLMIYRNVLPLLKRPDPTFLQEVEKALTDLLLHPKIGTQVKPF
ncbi:hypothetical protein BC938DRAFT_476973 [Jimgerdemannia flammicorona]|uniref:Armadillo-type protein n=1 Tax=Jimgerdemannia flammicorona TaxID=994334 RepID=A0A433PCX8_9FUNG|nr:hypothetical protein BC938DRAFT_476973 [Jimgerdemannia flammicorona]